MAAHPVSFRVQSTPHRDRNQLLIRLVLLVALGGFGCSSVYWLAYLSLPALAALLISQHGGARYLVESSPAILRALRWCAAAYAYLWLLTDEAPGAEGASPVLLEVETSGSPSAGSALARLVRSLPALVLLIVASFAAGILWLVAALCVLVSEQIPAAVSDFLTATLRYQFRLVAYHLSLVERYPSFDSSDVTHTSVSNAA